tara:strand:+ start:460 stop:1416 length:957 start_codon:yes stop_codon:yes gene_type:complete
MSSKDKRKLAAILFVDVVGYSRMMANNEERTLELLKDFDNICSPIISDNEGNIIKKVGDELFCEFSSAKQAVDCSLEIQKAIQPYNDSRPKDFKLQVRIGIHVGDIVLRDGDVFGDGVNVASRIQPFSSPGGICISNAVKESISSHPNYKIISEGQQELKNIIEKHTLYRVETGYEIVDTNRKIDKPRVEKENKWIKRFLMFIGFIIIMNLLASFVMWNLSNNFKIERSTAYFTLGMTKEEFNRKNPNITEIINLSNQSFTYIDSEQKYKYIMGFEIPLKFEEYMFEFYNDSLIAVYRGRNNYKREIDYSKYSNSNNP